MNKVIIVGCGNVSMSYALCLVNQKTKVGEIVLIDRNREKAEGEAMDLNHALAFAPGKIDIRAGDYDECSNAKIIVIAAGRNQEVGETRMDLVNKNIEVFKDIVGKVMKTGFNGIFIVATNPVDVMAYVTQKLSGFKHGHVLGSGTTLDTARLRFLVSEKLKVNVKNVHGYVLGEHGDSEFVAWSNMMVGTSSVASLIKEVDRIKIAGEVKNSAYDIIKKKGNTSYGIGMCLVKITEAILNDDSSVLTVSSYDAKEGIYYGKPTVVDKNGAGREFIPDLSDEEKGKLDNSIKVIKSVTSVIEQNKTLL